MVDQNLLPPYFLKKLILTNRLKMRFFKMAKMIFSQNSPAVRFISQRFRKWEIKKNLMAAEFGVDLFFEPGST